MRLSDISIIAWLQEHDIKTSRGEPFEVMQDHRYLYDVIRDFSPYQAIIKAAQIGASESFSLKLFYIADKIKADVIYTLPTYSDIQNMVTTKVNRLVAQNPVLHNLTKEGDSIERKQVGTSVIHYRGCVDEITEVLTEKGWSKFDEISIGDKLPTLNIEKNVIEMDSVRDMTVFDADEEMVRMKSDYIDQLVTQDHRCVITKRQFNGLKASLRIVKAHELIGKTTAYFPLRHNCEQAVMDYFYSVIGWVIGDGSYWTKRDKSHFVRKDGTINPTIYETPRVCIIQSKLCKELEGDLRDAGVKYFKKKHGKSCWRYELSSKDSKKIREIIPEKRLTHDLVFKMTQAQRRGVFRGLMMSDGDNYKNGFFYQNKNGTCDAFQALLVLFGRTSNLTERDEKKQIVTIKKNKWCSPVPVLETYKGKAWCPTTKNGTIFIRRNGKVSVTGQTFTERTAMMVPADVLVHDEIDASDQRTVSDYQARIQHSKLGWRWYFSHPTTLMNGVSRYFSDSDQKKWHIVCPDCKREQVMTWPESYDLKRGIYICTACQKEISDETRRMGKWKPTATGKFSGYWIPLHICPWISADYIIEAERLNPTDFFYNKVLGLPHVVPGGRFVSDMVFDNLIDYRDVQGQVVIGCDSGIRKHYVLGTKDGFFLNGSTEKWSDIEWYLKKFKNSIAVIDALPDITGPRDLRKRYPGRVFLCHYSQDRKTMKMIRWGKSADRGSVLVDRNRMLQFLSEEMAEGKHKFVGKRDEWLDFVDQLETVYRVDDVNALGQPTFSWESTTGNDHYLHALLYARTAWSTYVFSERGFMATRTTLVPIAFE